MFPTEESEALLQKKLDEHFKTISDVARSQRAFVFFSFDQISKNLSIGVWDNSEKKVQITVLKGKHFKSIGRHISGKLYLDSEETMYF